MTRQQAIQELCAPGQPYELQLTDIRGRKCRVFANAPPTLRDLYAGTRSDLDFLIYDDERMSFDQVFRRASALAKALLEDYGIRHGDRVAIAMRNYPEWVVTFFAVTSIGAIAVSINALWTADELSNSLLNCEPRLIVVDQDRLDRLADRVVPSGLRIIRVRAQQNARIASDEWNQVLSAHAGAEMPQASISPDDDATILYTSGSAGHPKGAVSSHRNIIHALLSLELDLAIRQRRGLKSLPVPAHQHGMLLAVPLFHVMGSHTGMLAALRSQRKLVCMYRWDVQLGMELIERERLTLLNAPSTITGDLVQAAASTKRDLSSLLLVGGGGAARAPEQVRSIGRLSAAVFPVTGWGMTETNVIGTTVAGDCYLQRPTSSGQCSAVLDLRVVDEHGNEVPAGERGELQVRGTSMFRAYWRSPDANAAAFDGDWFSTGDAALIDDEGYLYIVDRIKDLVIRGGENIGCGLVEAALAEHPDVVEACVYAVPDPRFGEVVAATLYVTHTLAESELHEFLANKLAQFEIPHYIHQQFEPLPRIASYKIAKRRLKTEAIERLGLGQVAAS